MVVKDQDSLIPRTLITNVSFIFDDIRPQLYFVLKRISFIAMSTVCSNVVISIRNN